jgi:hypothetical protein
MAPSEGTKSLVRWTTKRAEDGEGEHAGGTGNGRLAEFLSYAESMAQRPALHCRRQEGSPQDYHVRTTANTEPWSSRTVGSWRQVQSG